MKKIVCSIQIYAKCTAKCNLHGRFVSEDASSSLVRKVVNPKLSYHCNIQSTEVALTYLHLMQYVSPP